MSEPLEIRITLHSGNILRFEQDGPEELARILEHIHPSKMFSPKVTVVSGSHSMSAIETASIARIDLIGEDLPEWPYSFNAKNVLEIDDATFRAHIAEVQPRVEGRDDSWMIGQRVMSYSEMELASGEVVHLEIEVEVAMLTPHDVNMFIQLLFSAHALHGKRADGGLFLINPKQVVRFTFFPGPVSPPNALPASRIF